MQLDYKCCDYEQKVLALKTRKTGEVKEQGLLIKDQIV